MSAIQSPVTMSPPIFGLLGTVVATISQVVGAPARWFSDFMTDAEDIWDADMFLRVDDQWGTDNRALPMR